MATMQTQWRKFRKTAKEYGIQMNLITDAHRNMFYQGAESVIMGLLKEKQTQAATTLLYKRLAEIKHYYAHNRMQARVRAARRAQR